MGECAPQGDFTAIVVAEVYWPPSLDIDRAIVDWCVGGETVLKSGEIDERLESGAWLPHGTHSPVELALGVVAPANHRPDGAIGCQQQHRGLGGPRCAALGTHDVLHRIAGGKLQA